MRRMLFCLLLCYCLPAFCFAGQELAKKIPGGRDDQIIQRAIVPSVEKPQGEVQLLKRGDQLVARTLLASRILRRVAAAIDDKERRNWPETHAGHSASVRYREELFRATEKAWEQFRQRTDQSEVRQFLAIEFILDARKGMIALSLPVLRGDYGELSIIDRQVISSWRAPELYVQGNIIEIIKDSFQLDDAAASELLAPLWPGGKRTGE